MRTQSLATSLQIMQTTDCPQYVRITQTINLNPSFENNKKSNRLPPMEVMHSIDEMAEPQLIQTGSSAVSLLVSDIERLSMAGKAAMHEHRRLMASVDDWHARLTAANDKVKRVRRLKAEFESVIDRLGGQSVALEREVACLEDDLKSELERTCLMGEEVEEEKRLNSGKEQIDEQIRAAKAVLNKIREEKQSIIVKLKEQDRASKMALEESVSSLQNARQMSKLEADKLLSQITAMISSNAEIEQKVAQSSSILDALKVKNDALTSAVDSLTVQLEDFREAQLSSKQLAFSERKLKTQETKKLEQIMMSLAERAKACKEERAMLEAELSELA